MKNSNGDPKFQVDCDAGSAGHVRFASQGIAMVIGQRVLREGAQEMWDSVVVNCVEGEDGALGVRVIVFHPDWEQGREIAYFLSRPNQPEAPTLAFSPVPKVEGAR